MERQQGGHYERNKNDLESDLGKRAVTHHLEASNVHELPVQRHRVNHDDFIDGTHAAEADRDVVVELHPYIEDISA